MTISAENYGHSVILNVKGELTEDTLTAFEQAVDRALQEKMVIDLVLNLENVPFVDSRVLEYLLQLQDRLTDKLGQVKLLKCDENVLKILEITHLRGAFDIYSDATEAVKSLQP